MRKILAVAGHGLDVTALLASLAATVQTDDSRAKDKYIIVKPPDFEDDWPSGREMVDLISNSSNRWNAGRCPAHLSWSPGQTAPLKRGKK